MLKFSVNSNHSDKTLLYEVTAKYTIGFSFVRKGVIHTITGVGCSYSTSIEVIYFLSVVKVGEQGTTVNRMMMSEIELSGFIETTAARIDFLQ